MKFIREMIARKSKPSNDFGKKSTLGKEIAPGAADKKTAAGFDQDEIVLKAATPVNGVGQGPKLAQPDTHLKPPASGAAPKDIWDIDLDADDEPAAVIAAATKAAQTNDDLAPVAVPDPTAGRARPRSNRVKTRLLGFEHSDGSADVFEQTTKISKVPSVKDPVGWIVVVDGPGRGTAFTLLSGMSQIGRGEDQPIQLNFGDATISRENHASIAYDAESHQFFLGHGGKSNLVRLNSKPVLSTEALKTDDLIRIGETTLRLIALCNKDFNWDEDQGQHDQNGGEADDMAIA